MRIVIGRLRRDLILLGVETEDGPSIESIGEDAVKQGRAAEAFIIPVDAHFSESSKNWVEVDRGVVHGAQVQLPPLNPGSGGQAAVDDLDATPSESIRGNIEASQQAQIASGALVNTGKADTDHANAGAQPNPLGDQPVGETGTARPARGK